MRLTFETQRNASTGLPIAQAVIVFMIGFFLYGPQMLIGEGGGACVIVCARRCFVFSSSSRTAPSHFLPFRLTPLRVVSSRAGLCGAEIVGRRSVGASEGFLGWIAYLVSGWLFFLFFLFCFLPFLSSSPFSAYVCWRIRPRANPSNTTPISTFSPLSRRVLPTPASPSPCSCNNTAGTRFSPPCCWPAASASCSWPPSPGRRATCSEVQRIERAWCANPPVARVVCSRLFFFVSHRLHP